ncbi:MAG: peptidoglycan DD-metalloendopeptidase family protein [Akkermansiaceae bacterium]
MIWLMNLRKQTMIVGGVALLGMVFLLIVWLMKEDDSSYYAHSLRNWQEADAVAGHPMVVDPDAEEPEIWTAEYEPRLNLFREVERFQIPVAVGFTHPLGDFAKTEEATEKRVRFNSPAGGILGAGDPVFAAGSGMVFFNDAKRKLVILAHRLADGRIVTTAYGNVDRPTPAVGEIVARGEKIGVLAGTKENPGLHFEVREAIGIDLPEKGGANFLNPLQFLKEHANSMRWPDALSLEETEPGMESLELDTESAEKLGEILGN